MREPTDYERARWLRDGWGRKYNYAIDADRLTTRLEIREWRSVIRHVRARRDSQHTQKG